MRGSSIRASKDLLVEAVSPPTLIFTAFKTGYPANPCHRIALPSMNVDAPKANPLVAEDAKSHNLEGKDIVGMPTAGTVDSV